MLSAVLATVSVVDGSARAVVAGDHRRVATSLAAGELEAMRALPAEQLGFGPAAPGVEATFEGRQSVRLPDGVVEPASTVQRGGTRYEVRRWVTWEPLESAGRWDPEGVEHLTVEVRWDDRVVRQDSGVAPPSGPGCTREWTDPAVSAPVANGYVALAGAVEPGATTLALDAPRFGQMPVSGDLLLILQMTGPSAGRYEYAVAGSGVDGGVLRVSGVGSGGGLLRGYRSDGGSAAQVVRVPTVERLQVERLEAPPFDGRIGGVVAVDATLEVAGPLLIDVDGRGASVPTDAVEDTDEIGLVPGSGAAGAPGGGVVALRSPALRGAVEVHASGTGGAGVGAGGGSVLLEVGSGLEAATVRAVGGAASGGPGGRGGRVWSSSRPAVVDVSGGLGTPAGGAGTVERLRSGEVAGSTGRVGCLAALQVSKSTSTPVVATAGGGTARWSIRVANAVDRGVAGEVRLRDPLAAGVSYVATEGVRLEGGATRDEVVDPEALSSVPVWGSFTLPAGAAVEVTFRVAVADGQQGVLGNDADVEAESGGFALHAGYVQGQSSAEDVSLQAFSCATPWTDPDPGVLTTPPNTYLPLTGGVAAGAALLPVGTESGPAPVRPGDLVVVVQMTGPSAGRHEYAVATGREPGGLRIDGAGSGGGLTSDYGTDGAAQVVRVPTYPGAVLATTVRPPPWNGSTGGVLALDVTGPLVVRGGALDASAAGPAGKGAGASGGLVAVRAASVVGAGGSLRAAGADGSSTGGVGGTVVAVTATGSVESLALGAPGGAGRRNPGAGGRVVMSGPAASVDVAGGGAEGSAGTVVDGARPADTRGVGLGVGCRPVLQVSVTAPAPATWRVRGASAPVVVTVANLAGRPPVSDLAVSAWLPRGVEVLSTDSVELSGGATRPAGRDPTVPSGAAEWGGFELPGAATVSLRATVGFPAVDPGTLEVTASARGEGPTGSTSVAGPGPASFVLGPVVTRRSPAGIRSGLSGADAASLWPSSTTPLVPGAPPTALVVAASSRLLPAEPVEVAPQPSSARVGAVVSATVPSAQVCLYAEAFDLVSGETVGAGGPLGTAAAPAACVGGSPTPVELELPARRWSAAGLGQVGVRWYLSSPQGSAARVEGAWFAFDWQDRTWSAPATAVSGQLSGGERRDALAAADGVVLGLGGLPRNSDGARALDATTAVPVAGDAVVDSSTAIVVWRPGGGRVCVRTQWTVDGAPVGSVSAPVCRSSGGWATDRFSPGAVASSDLGRLGVRLLAESQNPNARLELDAVEVEVGWWRR
jgi:hypothetical protein